MHCVDVLCCGCKIKNQKIKHLQNTHTHQKINRKIIFKIQIKRRRTDAQIAQIAQIKRNRPWDIRGRLEEKQAKKTTATNSVNIKIPSENWNLFIAFCSEYFVYAWHNRHTLKTNPCSTFTYTIIDRAKFFYNLKKKTTHFTSFSFAFTPSHLVLLLLVWCCFFCCCCTYSRHSVALVLDFRWAFLQFFTIWENCNKNHSLLRM